MITNKYLIVISKPFIPYYLLFYWNTVGVVCVLSGDYNHNFCLLSLSQMKGHQDMIQVSSTSITQ